MVHADLTRRELDVLQELLEGRSTQEAAERLVVSHGTLRTHLRNVRRKTQTRHLHGIVGWAYRHTDCCVNRVVIREPGPDAGLP